jgi:hypothetical protein
MILLASQDNAWPDNGSLTMAKGLDGRARDRDGEIRQKRGDTLNKNLSKPIRRFSPNATLAKMRKVTGKVSEDAVRRAAKKLYP